MSQLKECSVCHANKPVEDFPIHKKSTGARRTRCNACQNAYWRSWRAANAEKHRASVKRWRENNAESRRAEGRRRFYGLTPEDTASMLAAQDAACAICRSEIHDGPDGFCVDHNHVTGEVRGLLCRKCNVLLGMASDDPSVLAAAIQYLEESG